MLHHLVCEGGVGLELLNVCRAVVGQQHLRLLVVNNLEPML
jgi:hypothetical protein